MKWWALSELNSFLFKVIQDGKVWLSHHWQRTETTANTQVHYQKGQDHSITFTLDCKFHQDCIYSCLYSTQLMGLGSWQEAGLGPSPHCLGSRWEGTQESCPLGPAHHTTLFSPSRELGLSSTLGFWRLPPIHFSGFQVPRCFWKLWAQIQESNW